MPYTVPFDVSRDPLSSSSYASGAFVVVIAVAAGLMLRHEVRRKHGNAPIARLELADGLPQ